MQHFAGIDIGSRTCKGVVVSGDGEVASHEVLPSGTGYALTAKQLWQRLLAKSCLARGDVAYVIATGHNARLPFANEYVTDIQCCARGVRTVFPLARTIVDIQAQTSQVIRLGETGLVSNFVVSEKCAAGSGRFLDVVANVLRVELVDLGPLSLKSTRPVTFSTGCAVFGESEAISRVAEGMSKEDILAGVHRSIADKISSLVARVGMEEPCAIVGGGALNAGLVISIEQKLGVKANVPPRPQLIAAIGAAAIAEERTHRTVDSGP
jgi:predicted CoA-substrate-specific enzyme activase